MLMFLNVNNPVALKVSKSVPVVKNYGFRTDVDNYRIVYHFIS